MAGHHLLPVLSRQRPRQRQAATNATACAVERTIAIIPNGPFPAVLQAPTTGALTQPAAGQEVRKPRWPCPSQCRVVMSAMACAVERTTAITLSGPFPVALQALTIGASSLMAAGHHLLPVLSRQRPCQRQAATNATACAVERTIAITPNGPFPAVLQAPTTGALTQPAAGQEVEWKLLLFEERKDLFLLPGCADLVGPCGTLFSCAIKSCLIFKLFCLCLLRRQPCQFRVTLP